MLVKVKFRSEQKYVKVSHCDLKLSDFLDEGNCICNYIYKKISIKLTVLVPFATQLNLISFFLQPS